MGNVGGFGSSGRTRLHIALTLGSVSRWCFGMLRRECDVM